MAIRRSKKSFNEVSEAAALYSAAVRRIVGIIPGHPSYVNYQEWLAKTQLAELLLRALFDPHSSNNTSYNICQNLSKNEVRFLKMLDSDNWLALVKMYAAKHNIELPAPWGNG